MKLTVFGEADRRTLAQIERCGDEADFGVLCADNHLGYSMPIGGGIAYSDYISPSGVGYDIGCGNKAVKTSLLYQDVRADLPRIMGEVASRISFGMGRPNREPVDHPVLDKIRTDAPLPVIGSLAGLAARQLGTVGGGNHYVDLFREPQTDRVWVGVHFGSRGFGHKIASGFLALAEGKRFDERAASTDMDAGPTLLHTAGALGHLYVEAMTLAGEYAYAGRDVVCDKVLEILGAESMFEVHNHHNYAWREEHFGAMYWVVRKGCTPAFPDQRGFVGGSMGDVSVILEGRDTDRSRDALFSTVHGAGRRMSRNEAKGKFRRRKVWACNDRDCDRMFSAGGSCPDHPDAKVTKRWVEERKTEGKIDWQVVKADLEARGIVLVGGDADEAPGAYKRLPDVLAAHGDTINVLHTLEPIGVAMAGPGIRADD